MQEDKKLLRYSFGVCDQMKKDNYYLENYSNNLSMQPEEVRSITARVKSNIKQYENQLLQNSQGKKGKDLMKFIGNVKNAMKQQGDQGQTDFLYQQQRMQAQEQIDDEDIEFYNDYFPNSMIDPGSNYEQQLIEQFAKMQTFSQNHNAFGVGESSNNYLSLTNNTSNLNVQNMVQTPTTPQQGSAPNFQSSHSQDQLIKHHKEFLEAQKNKHLSLSQSQKYFNQKADEQILPQSVTRQRDIDNDLFGINSFNNNNSAHQMKLMRNHSSLEASTNILGSAKGVRNAHSGMSTNNILNGKNEVSYISDYQNNHMIQENINDSLKIEDEIQPIPNEGDMKYEDQSYLDSYLLYKNSISQLNCAEDINLEENQQQGSMVFYNNLNPNYILNAQSSNDHSQANGAQYQKFYLNQTNFLQNMDEYDGNNEPQLPQSCLPHFVNAQINYEDSNLNFNEENVYLEEKYVQDMLYMRRPNSANYLIENMEQSSNHVQKDHKQAEKRKTFIESTKTNIPNAAKAKERSITHNTSFEQKLKNQQNSNKMGYQQQLQKTNSFKVQTDKEKEYKMVNKENNLSQAQLNVQHQQARDKSIDIEKVDQNAVKIGKFISKRYVNKENKKPTTSQLSYKTPETALRANEDFLNQKTKNYLEILKKHLRTDQINTANKTQKHTLNQVQANTTQYQPQQTQAKAAPKVNNNNNTFNKNNSPTKRLSNIYKINRNQPAPAPLPLYNTNDHSSTNQTMTTAATTTPTLRQNHSFVTQKKGDENQEAKQEIAKSIGIPHQNQQKKQDLANPYNINMKNIALTRYNKTANNTIQNTMRTNRNTKDEITNKNMTNHNQFTNANNLATVLFNATQAVAQPAAAVKKNINPTSQNTVKQAQPYVPSTQKPSSSSAAQSLFDDININNFKFEQEIGKGSYATVKLAIDRASQIRYALKIYPRFVLLDPHKMRNVKREIAILRKLQHPFIIKMPFAIEDKQNQIIVGMEYVGKQSLHGYLKTKTDRKLEEPEVKRLFRQIVEGVNYCHKMSVVHRDIKLENILLDQSNNIKIIDFGFSIINGEDKKLKIFCGTPSYMAPEIVSKIEYIGQKADIWALGILLFVMLQGKFPFKGVNDNELFKKIKKGSFTYTHPVSSDAEKLISQLLNVRPSERPSLPIILEHSWFSQQN
ncbi:Serine/Threonine kinase domain protein (macronuclear) [Tetrahymena thermophila SB210]|uniref:Serine/Threonine kinase domain protein n=1 Tax=Tetrahymena thermophila (strain SB210) TaxID=312017 RepID=Q23D39_TETTS|nr:Serine/Threonine kinase domain protein [Tetrahymena thermophila SB210]EAR94679.2 Serine/Threonine kinase domain protein [Tetrahymena thermophila SB210]|eukprot:XP_001014847.2 Serine/Threonine kinase domain protein [Tetrahymena thermophila SB210]